MILRAKKKDLFTCMATVQIGVKRGRWLLDLSCFCDTQAGIG